MPNRSATANQSLHKDGTQLHLPMLNDRVSTLRKIYAPKSAAHRKAVPTRNAENASRLSQTPSFPPATPIMNGRMSAYTNISIGSSKYGRSPSRERLDDYQQEILTVKKNCAKLTQENVLLRTKLRKLSAVSGKREHHLQSLLSRSFQPSESMNSNEALTITSFKQKFLKGEMLIKQQAEQIKKLKEERLKMNASTSNLEQNNNELKKEVRGKTAAKTRSVSIDTYVEENKRLLEKLKLLKKENKQLRLQIEKLQKPIEENSELSKWSKAELISLVERLESRQLRAPIRAAVATLEQTTEIGRLTSQLKTISGDLDMTKQENDQLREEVDNLIRDLEIARLNRPESVRPPQVPPLDMKSVENSVFSDEEAGPSHQNLDDDEEFFEENSSYVAEVIPPKRKMEINYDQVATNIVYIARAHVQRENVEPFKGGSA